MHSGFIFNLRGLGLLRRRDEMCAEDGHTQRMTLHCLQCSTVLGDSLRVTDDVVVSDAMKSGHKGEMASISSSLKCRGCGSAVGSVIHSAPSSLAAVRSMFLLQKKKISCYILNRRSMEGGISDDVYTQPKLTGNSQMMENFRGFRVGGEKANVPAAAGKRAPMSKSPSSGLKGRGLLMELLLNETFLQSWVSAACSGEAILE
ncbi:hypothetical protein F7725_008467 [Dissostichus mawsoni]|uniref:Mis18 domain-containing protein n=1 Tax=Dissostichus mawsoni TaxID=36200 RepID=A0A7J5Y797_DISMA|nr:hypothetical protein F7725_008467 [Dissostichus mawsoni]